MLIKFTAPSSLDIAPFKEIWQTNHSDGSHDYHIQMSEDKTRMDWQRLGYIMEKAFCNRFHEENCFLDEMLQSYYFYKLEQESKKTDTI